MSDYITLAYHRPPDRTERFVQKLVYESDDVLVTFLAHTPMKRTMFVNGELALEAGSPAVWFTFPGLMHDIARFHDANGRFTGIYANIMEPVELQSRLNWRATDLFLDLWLSPDGRLTLLDEDELEGAIAANAIDRPSAERARAEARRLIELHRAGSWPPAVVNDWPIERVLKDI